MRVRLTRRLATSIDGIDLSAHRVGDVLDLKGAEGELLIAEGWATRVVSCLAPASARRRSAAGEAEAERRHAWMTDELGRLQQQIRGQAREFRECRRAEDLIRDAWHDQHAKTFGSRHSTRQPAKARR